MAATARAEAPRRRAPTLHAAEQAVSPVIGTILMVAITVVLAVVIVLFVNPQNEDAEPPTLAFRRHEEADRLMLVRGTNGDWGDMRLFVPEGNGAGIRYELNDEPDGTSPEIGEGVVMPVKSLDGGDYVQFCADGGAEDQSVSLVHLASNSLVYKGEFRDLAPC